MGLFSKKELCPVCGKKIKGDLLVRIKDNLPLCAACSAMVNMDAVLIPLQTEESIRNHIDYRKANQIKVESFTPNLELKAGSSLFKVDESAKLWYCTRNKKDKNPPVFSYEELVSAQYLEDGEPLVEEEAKGGLSALFGGKKEARMVRSMKVRLELSNPYTQFIDVEVVGLNDEVKVGSMGYKSNRRSLDKILEAAIGMMNFVSGGTDAAAEEI